MPLLKKTPKANGPLIMEPMRWLFTAYFSDGSTIVQDQDDKCSSRDDGTGSTFTDVLARDDLIAFSLSHTNKREAVLVDLKTGAFSINGTPVHLHNQFFDPDKYKLELVYFRETRAEQTLNARGDQTSQRHYVNRYFMGWKTEVNGKPKQVTLAVG